MQFLKKHIETISLLLLLLVCFFLYFFAMGEYSLIDVDESRYVTIARDMISTNDWLTLRLNGEFFFEKPPLYFWLVNLSFLMFHKISEYTARFPIALLSTVCVFLTYFSVKKMTSRRVGMLTALVMATSLEYLLLSKIAILDIVLSVFKPLFNSILNEITNKSYKCKDCGKIPIIIFIDKKHIKINCCNFDKDKKKQ